MTTIPVSMQVLLKGQMRFMQQHGFEVTMVSSDGPEKESLEKQEQCPLVTVPLSRSISPFKDLVCLVKLVRLFRQLKPDIVHTHTPKAGLLGMWAARLAGVPVRLHTIAGLQWIETAGALRILLRLMEKLTATAATQVYPNSFVLKNFLQKQNIATGKMKVLGKGSSNGIDTNFFSLNDDIAAQATHLRSERQISNEACVWIFIGRLVKDKGVPELIDAFQQLYNQFSGDRLWLVGLEEPTLDPLSEVHRQLIHAHPAIECMGFQKDIRPYLAAAQVLVFPSHREGFPNVPMQAGAMGCTLLLSNINGCNEIVEDKKNGLLFPAKNTKALTEAMLFIREQPAIRIAYAKTIRQKIEQEFGQQQLWNLILQEYQYWLGKKGVTS